MKPLRAALVAFVLSVSATPAHAGLIGLIGGDFDPEWLTDPDFFGVGDCDESPVALPSDYRCVFYHYDDDVESIDFRLDDGSGLIPVADESIFVDTEFSDFDTLETSELFADGFTFHLTGYPPIFAPFCDGEECPLLGLVFFVGPDSFHPDITGFSVSTVAVSGVKNPGAKAIPEPATLFLLGPAAAALLARRARRNRNRPV
jgi:hypothetical protein